MKKFLDFLNHLFGTDNWHTRFSSGNWNEFHAWISIISSALTGAAFIAISCLIVYYIVKKRARLPFISVFWLFAAFIFICGLYWLVDLGIFWWPLFGLKTLINMVAGILSWITVILLVRNLPAAFLQPTAAELEAEVQRRMLIEEELNWKNKELEEIQKLAHVGSWRFDIETNKFRGSTELHRLFGIDPGKNVAVEEFLALIHPGDIERVRVDLGSVFSTGVSNHTVYRIIRTDGQARVIQTMAEANPGNKGKPDFLRGTAQDITQIKEAEEVLARKALELEQTNSELEIFAYSASHDMQEPLRKIRSFADRIKLKYYDKIEDTGREYLDKITNASTRMQLLINDLLIYSKVVSGNYHTEKVNLNKIIKEVVSDLEVIIQEKKATITINELPQIEAIPSQMRQLFQNLLTNSLKFVRPDVPPLISISAEKTIENGWRIHIKDNGIGFDEKYSDKIFLVFQRLHGRREYEGTGIGLAMVKKIVDRHQGSVEVHSSRGEGSVFTLILPEKQPQNGLL